MSEQTAFNPLVRANFVGRSALLEAFKGWLTTPPADLHIILLPGKGGMGKTKLLEELLHYAGNPQYQQKSEQSKPTWGLEKKVVFTQPLDMYDIEFNLVEHLLQAIRQRLVNANPLIDFINYDNAYEEYQQQREFHAQFKVLQTSEDKVKRNFLEDYRRNAKNFHLVIALDTVERVTQFNPQWLRDLGMLNAEDLAYDSLEWLVQAIEQGWLPNTTLVLAGRDDDHYGQPFFNKIRKAAGKNKHCKLDMCELDQFSPEEVRAYLIALADEWKKDERRSSQVAGKVAESYANSAEQVELLHLCTNGQPIRLAIYTDLLLSGKEIPEQLLSSREVIQQEISRSNGLKKIQTEIEARFIHSLFNPDSVENQLLLTLVRIPIGVDEEQLKRIMVELYGYNAAAVTEAIKTLPMLSVYRERPGKRLGLQDEIYTIFANHRKINGSKKDEIQERRQLYKFLWSYAEQESKTARTSRDAWREQEERELQARITDPLEAWKVEFPKPDYEEIHKRRQNLEKMGRWEREQMYYALCLSPAWQINNSFFDLAMQRGLANDIEADVLYEAVLHQVIYNHDLVDFIEYEDWGALKRYNTPAIDALRRVAQQDEVIRWMARFAYRPQIDRALQLSKETIQLIGNPPKEIGHNEYARHSWQHTFFRSQVQVFSEYARILQGEKSEEAIDHLHTIVKNLELLRKGERNDAVNIDGRIEYGFKGHPAERRLMRVIALACNFIGYGYANLGRLTEAKKSYARALKLMRETKSEAHIATILNNLSRVLSDMGRQRSRRLCLDGYRLRRKLGDDIPLALSINTLALIDNDNLRPESAWVEAATALVYFKRSQDDRGRGLACLQLGEALRRLAWKDRLGLRLPDKPKDLLKNAETVLGEARKIFTDPESPASKELARRIESYIEFGCLQRDQLPIFQDIPAVTLYSNARNNLEKAINLAEQVKNVKLELDAQINIAWTHYSFATRLMLDFADSYKARQPEIMDQIENYITLTTQDIETAERLLSKIDRDEKKTSEITKGTMPKAQRDTAYVFQQRGKIESLLGRIAMDRFLLLAEKYRAKGPSELEQITDPVGSEQKQKEQRERLSQDEEVHLRLGEAARAFVKSLAYAQLYSPRSSALSQTYDTLYEYLKKFNQTELKLFRKYETLYRSKSEYNIGSETMVLQDLGNLDEFLDDCFGEHTQDEDE